VRAWCQRPGHRSDAESRDSRGIEVRVLSRLRIRFRPAERSELRAPVLDGRGRSCGLSDLDFFFACAASSFRCANLEGVTANGRPSAWDRAAGRVSPKGRRLRAHDADVVAGEITVCSNTLSAVISALNSFRRPGTREGMAGRGAFFFFSPRHVWRTGAARLDARIQVSASPLRSVHTRVPESPSWGA